MCLATWKLLSLIPLTLSHFTVASPPSHLTEQPSHSRLQRRSGQIPTWNNIPGGGQEMGTDELERSAQLIKLNQFAAVIPGDSPSPSRPMINDPLSLSEKPITLSTYQQKSPLRIVSNSGVCETRPGVKTYSGYIPINQNQSMFFWLFEARKNPDTSPLSVWINGGPGSSSMIGLFQENGPCRIKLDSSGLDDNPYSWSESANMLYIDQPIGAGFSYGTTTVKTSLEAAIAVYNALQLFYSEPTFKKFVGRDFALWTESYGGHYAPTMVDYFLQQNRNVGQTGNFVIPIKTLGIGNGLVSPLAQYPSYMAYAKSNSYKQLVSDDVIANATRMYNQGGGCKALITRCQTSFDPTMCSNAQAFCNNNILGPLSGKQDVYDVRASDPDPYPPALEPLLTQVGFQKLIGAETNWTASNYDVYDNFFATGDWMLNSSPQLERVINSGIRTLLFDGDADYILNYMGMEDMVDSLNTTFSEKYGTQEFTDWMVEGQPAGLYKNAGTFSYLRVYGAGHEVPAYGYQKLERGKAALLFFQQAMNGLPISSYPSVPTTHPKKGFLKTSSASRLASPFSIYKYLI